MATYRVRNWNRFQHYKKRNPSWVKLHCEVLCSVDWVQSDDATRVLMVACLVMASKTGGVITCNPGYLQRVAYLNSPPDFTPLIDSGFLVIDDDASNTVHDASNIVRDASNIVRDARPEAEAEAEAEAEKKLPRASPEEKKTLRKPEPDPVDTPEIKAILDAYPKRKGNLGLPQARKRIAKIIASGEYDAAQLLMGVRRYADECDALERTGTEFVRMASTFFGRDQTYAEYAEGAPGADAVSAKKYRLLRSEFPELAGMTDAEIQELSDRNRAKAEAEEAAGPPEAAQVEEFSPGDTTAGGAAEESNVGALCASADSVEF